jgi:hypothetical protein
MPRNHFEPFATGSPEYKHMHNIVLPKERGKASKYLCSEESCGNNGAQWSWVHGLDPRDPYSYDPLCYSCHGKYDYTQPRREAQRVVMLGNDYAKGNRFTHTNEAREKMSVVNQGENHHGAKLTEQNIHEIRELWRTCNWTQRELAEMFGVSQPTICAIVNYYGWKHI